MNEDNEKSKIIFKELEEKIDLMIKEINEKDEKIETNWNLFIIAKAEIENLKKQNIKDIENIQKYVLKDFSKELINVVDGLENVLKTTNEFNTGTVLVYKMLTSVLEKHGVKKIDSKENDMFNPLLHEAIYIEKNDEKENNLILKVLQTGYTINEQILRYSKVSISERIVKNLNQE